MGFNRVDPYLKEAIQVWCLFESLRDAKTKRGMVSAITQYLQAHVSQSIPYYLYTQLTNSNYISDWTSTSGHEAIEEMVEEVFGEDSVREIDGELVVLDTQEGGESEPMPWHKAVDGAFSNWKEFRESSIAKRFTHLINVVVSAGMCSTAALTFKLGTVSLFSPIVTKKQLAASDVFEAFYEAVAGFMKGGWRVYQTGEVSAFFMEDDKISEFDDKYNQILSWHGYALAGNLREYTEIDDNEYEIRLTKAIEFGDNLLKFVKRTQVFERKYVSDRLDRLRNYQVEFTQLRTRGGLRISPFSISLFGPSGCGKSSLTNLTVNAGLIYNELSAEKDRIATWADNDKYASSIRSHINAIIFDDFANTNEKFMDFSPAYRLIQVINNIRYLAPMADVFLKGKVSLNPYFCIISTNVRHLNASVYSNEPESVLRRMYHVTVKPKSEFCSEGILDSAKILKAFGRTPCPDVWDLTICKYEAINKRFLDLQQFKPIEFEGKAMVDVSVRDYLRWVQIASKQHFTEEGQYLANQEQVPLKCPKCSMVYCLCGLDREASNPSVCSVVDETSNEESSLPIASNCPVLNRQSGQWNYCMAFKWINSSYFQRKADQIKDFTARATTQSVIQAQRIIYWWERFDYLPECWICHPSVLKFGLFFWRNEVKQSLISGNVFFLFMCLSLMWACPNFSLFWLFSCAATCYWYTCITIQTYKILVRERILEVKDVVKTYTNSWQVKYAIIGLGAIAVVLCTLRSRARAAEERALAAYEERTVQMWREWRVSELEPNTGLNPENMSEVNERNDRANPWLKAESVPLPMSEPSKTTTCMNLARSMGTNLVGIVSDNSKTTLGFYICSNFLIVPTHFIEEHGERDIAIRCYKKKEGAVGSYFRDTISGAFSVPVIGTDFTICFITSGGSMKDFRKFLPTDDILMRSPARLITRDIMDNTLSAIPTLFKGSMQVAHTKRVFWGSYYDLPIETRNGMCMSPVISDAKGSVILGFHLGGKGKLGGCGTLTIDQVNSALAELAAVDGVVLSASCGDLIPHMGDFPEETFGKSIHEGDEIHPKSATNFLTEGACIDIYGKTSGKATPHSEVCATMISSVVSKVFGVPQKWGPPKMKGKGRYPYQATLAHAAIPSLPLGSVLSKAVRSFKGLTTGLKERIPELFHARPLTRVETVCGIIGQKFIDAMNFNSSPGFPLSGSKHPLLVDLNPEDYPNVGKPRTFVPEVWAEFERICAILVSGRRCYMIWKSCLKDEATKLTKDKVRVFQSAPLVLQLIIRMYFLPIVRIIQMNPILYECAVGVNAEGLEWEELWEAAMSKGRDRVLAGDYSKYDVRMPAQVTIAAFDILIDIAEKCDGYTGEDLHLMKMVVSEVVYPVMAYNGDLIQLFGTNPSGQNLTVIINSLVNSLLLRSCFFTIYPGKEFKEHCSFLTYGDDVIGTVSADCGGFTHITYADFLAEHDMKFTMPDKESVPKHYMREDEVDFLKRRCEFNEDLGHKIGVLSEESIFKRLHAHLRSKELTPEMHSAQNIESSLHDWFFYGKDVFEDRREKLSIVAKDCGIIHLCPALELTYEERVNRWKQKYLGEGVEKEDEPVILETQCGSMFVETVDFTDHCIGSALNPFFKWEHICADISLIVVPLIWIGLCTGRLTYKWGFPSRGWIYFLVFTTNGLRTKPILKWFAHFIYATFYCTFWQKLWHVVTYVVSTPKPSLDLGSKEKQKPRTTLVTTGRKNSTLHFDHKALLCKSTPPAEYPYLGER